MKKLILHIVLLSYSVVLLKPVLPYVSDLVGHTLFYAKHMATIHVENGKMHIHKEIVENAKKAASEKEVPSSNKENTTVDHICFQQIETTAVSGLNRIFQIPVSAALQYNYQPADYPPPRA